jgi:uncharacterized protein with LGFP repeats
MSGYAQQKSDSSDTSLGDIARKLKAQKSKEPKPALVITNDNLPATKNDSETSPTSKDKVSGDSVQKNSGEPAEPHDEKYYRARLSKLQDQLDTDKRELDVTQQKLSQNQVQYYSNPQDSLMQQYSREDVNKLTSGVDEQKQKVAADEKAIEDLHDQLRHEGGDPDWLR